MSALTWKCIEAEVAKIKGGHIKRSNLRKKLIDQSNHYVNERILATKGVIRDLRAMAAKEEALRHWYSELTKLEEQIL